MDAHIWTDSLASNTDFIIDDAFAAWNATNAAGAQWTLVQGGALPGGQFNVSIFDAKTVGTTLGGLEINVDWTYAGADKTDYVWVQGLLDNYLLNGSIVSPFYEMDINNAGCTNTGVWDVDGNRRCAPAYPYQYADRKFYDFPKAPWPNSFFDADAYLSKIDYTARTLTIYEGVHYGFNLNAVPLPAAVWLFGSGLAGLIGFARRSKMA